MTLFVFLARATRAGIIASDLGSCFHRFRRFGLRRSRLVLQIALLPLLPSFHRARKIWHSRRRRGSFLSSRRRTGYRSLCILARTGWLRNRLLLALGGWLPLLNLYVIEIAHRFVVDARHHIFKQNERFLLELNQRIFLTVTAQPNSFF